VPPPPIRSPPPPRIRNTGTPRKSQPTRHPPPAGGPIGPPPQQGYPEPRVVDLEGPRRPPKKSRTPGCAVKPGPGRPYHRPQYYPEHRPAEQGPDLAGPARRRAQPGAPARSQREKGTRTADFDRRPEKGRRLPHYLAPRLAEEGPDLVGPARRRARPGARQRAKEARTVDDRRPGRGDRPTDVARP
jgi:hypothetical protein